MYITPEKNDVAVRNKQNLSFWRKEILLVFQNVCFVLLVKTLSSGYFAKQVKITTY